MNNYQSNSPVLLLLFNRPNETRQLLEVISKVQPKQLFISIDGPRNDNDKDQINKILDNISEKINFDCDLRIQKQEKNLGCGLGPRAGISWFFENVEEGIILEDDCIPSESFFEFCDTLLKKYKNNKNIWIISGDNGGPILNEKYFYNTDYIFSNIPLIWGWASWKDRWEKYDENLSNWNYGTLQNLKYLRHVSLFEKFIVGRICKNSSKTEIKNFWDFQLYSSMLKNKGFAIIPRINLISNIGWGDIATHTVKESFRTKVKTNNFKTIKHNDIVQTDKKINNIITYSIHTNTPKRIINLEKLYLVRIFYLLKRLQYYFSYIRNFIK